MPGAEGAGSCRICGGEGTHLRVFGQRRAERLGLYRCQRCGCEFLLPAPSDEWLAEEYRDYYVRRGEPETRAKDAFFDSLLSRVASDFDGVRVLDVGAAEGGLLRALLRRWPSARVCAVEGNSEARPLLEGLPGEYFAEDLAAWLARGLDRRFDVIFLCDLLEHLRDPVTALARLVERHLEPGGRVVGTFPMASSLSRRLLGRAWPQYKVEHLHYFSPLAIAALEGAAGLRRETLAPLAKQLPIGYWLDVGSGFGPAVMRRVSEAAAAVLPRGLRGLHVSLRSGEALWIACRAIDSSPVYAPKSKL